MSVTEKIFDLDFGVPYVCVGIDPGQVNMGLVFVYLQTAYCYQIKLPGGVDLPERIVNTLAAVKESFLLAREAGVPIKKIPMGVVEMAAYGAPFGQVPLSEARTAAVVALMREGVKSIHMMSPGQIRLKAFGNGKTKAESVYDIPGFPDAVAALGCAIAASRID